MLKKRREEPGSNAYFGASATGFMHNERILSIVRQTCVAVGFRDSDRGWLTQHLSFFNINPLCRCKAVTFSKIQAVANRKLNSQKDWLYSLRKRLILTIPLKAVV